MNLIAEVTAKTTPRAAFPFGAIVRHAEVKLALVLTAIDQGLGGVLVFGDRGTGKSTAVRALTALLPLIDAVAGCRVNSAQAGDCADRARATEDRVVGAPDIERAITRGKRPMSRGCSRGRTGGFLYIDEVNLLEDHIVDLLLDVAQSGENVVERDGLSIRHAARFVLVGSGNPEEGELRPQLLDRFGLAVEVGTPRDPAQRVEVILRREGYERDHAAFMARWQAEDAALCARIVAARGALARVQAPPEQ